MTGRSLNEVMAELAAEDQAQRDSLNVTLSCGNRTWNVTAEELDYASDYESVARAAWQIGHEGSIAQRYQAIRQLQQGGANFAVTRNPEIPSCLVEADFITHPAGEEAAWDAARRARLAEAIARGFADWHAR